jgi:hypothetical protein
MSYNYQTMRPQVFTEAGQLMFLKIRDNAQEKIKNSGCVMSHNLMSGCTGDTWMMLACIDRLVEIGELVEVRHSWSAAGQHRIFIGKNL